MIQQLKIQFPFYSSPKDWIPLASDSQCFSMVRRCCRRTPKNTFSFHDCFCTSELQGHELHHEGSWRRTVHHQPQQRKIALPNITELWISKKFAPLFVVHAFLTGQSRICKSPPAMTRQKHNERRRQKTLHGSRCDNNDERFEPNEQGKKCLRAERELQHRLQDHAQLNRTCFTEFPVPP